MERKKEGREKMGDTSKTNKAKKGQNKGGKEIRKQGRTEEGERRNEMKGE